MVIVESRRQYVHNSSCKGCVEDGELRQWVGGRESGMHGKEGEGGCGRRDEGELKSR